MITAIDVMRGIVSATDERMRAKFHKSDAFITFQSGKQVTIANVLMEMTRSNCSNPFPLVAVFTEGITESEREDGVMEFKYPKIAIAIRTVEGGEQRKLDESFRKVLHPIFNEMCWQIEKANFGYHVTIKHTDVPAFGDKGMALNNMCDAVIIKDLSILYKPKCTYNESKD